MKKKTLPYSLLILLTCLVSCDFGDINVDPTRQSDASLREILPGAIVQSARNVLSIGGRVAGVFVQHFEGTEAQPLTYNNYLVDEQTLSDYWETGLYAGAMKDCKLIIEKAVANNQPYYEGIAKVLMAFNLGIATSFWGDVPYTQALNGAESLKSPYDTQETIYESIHNLLDEALVAFEKPAVIGSPTNDDLIYGGNATKWLATVHALKARYYLHLTKRRPDAATLALNHIQLAFKSNANQPMFRFGNSDNESNPLALFGKERPQQMEIGKTLSELMTTKNDPRRTKFWSEVQGKKEIFLLDNTNLLRAQRSSGIPLISYAELLFMQAECYVRTGDNSKASSTFTQGIIASMDALGIAAAQYNAYLAFNSGINPSLSEEEKIARIIQQKYIALYGENPHEAWVDYRRTGYPVLKIPANANSSFNPSLVIPKRILYTLGERTTNEENYRAAIDRQGGHLMDVSTWAWK